MVVVLVAVILGAVNGTLRTGVSAYRRCRAVCERETVADDALRLLRRDLHRLAPAAGGSGPLIGTTTADGTPLLRLHTTAAPGGRGRDLRVDYFFVPPADTQAGPNGPDARGVLARRAAPRGPAPGAGVFGQPADAGEQPAEAYYETLVPHLAGWDVAYYDGAEWSESWTPSDRGAPPRLVRVRLRFAAGRYAGPAERQLVLPVVIEAPLLGPDGGAEE